MSSLKLFLCHPEIPGVNYLKVVVRLHLDRVPWRDRILEKCLLNKTLCVARDSIFPLSTRTSPSTWLLFPTSQLSFPPTYRLPTHPSPSVSGNGRFAAVAGLHPCPCPGRCNSGAMPEHIPKKNIRFPHPPPKKKNNTLWLIEPRKIHPRKIINRKS